MLKNLSIFNLAFKKVQNEGPNMSIKCQKGAKSCSEGQALRIKTRISCLIFRIALFDLMQHRRLCHNSICLEET